MLPPPRAPQATHTCSTHHPERLAGAQEETPPPRTSPGLRRAPVVMPAPGPLLTPGAWAPRALPPPSACRTRLGPPLHGHGDPERGPEPRLPRAPVGRSRPSAAAASPRPALPERTPPPDGDAAARLPRQVRAARRRRPPRSARLSPGSRRRAAQAHRARAGGSRGAARGPLPEVTPREREPGPKVPPSRAAPGGRVTCRPGPGALPGAALRPRPRVPRAAGGPRSAGR